jgi:hypothetical protein
MRTFRPAWTPTGGCTSAHCPRWSIPASLTDVRRVEAMLPRIDLPELVLEVISAHPNFAEALTHISGNEARADLGLSVAAVLCAHAMNVGFAPVTTPGYPLRG